MKQYTLVLEQSPNNWAGYVVDLPVIVATGATIEEVIEVLTEAITLHLEALKEYDMPTPESMDIPELNKHMTTRTIEVPV